MYTRFMHMIMSVLVGLAAVQAAAAQNKIVMKIGHVLSVESAYHLTALELARLVKQKSAGRIEVLVFPQAQLGGEVQMAQALRTGTQELMISSTGAIENTVKQFQIFDLPFLFSGFEDGNRVMQGPVGKKFLDMLPAANIVGLAWLSVLERDLFTTKKPVNSLSDLKNMKIRVMQSPGYIAGYKALGANPTPMAYSQLFLALSQGLVDGADTSPDQMIQDKFSDISKHFYLTRVNYLPALITVGQNAWSRLSPDLQKALKEAADEAGRFHLVEYRKQYEKGLVQLKATGTMVHEVDTRAWIAATQAVRSQLTAKVPDGAALYAEIMAARRAAPGAK